MTARTPVVQRGFCLCTPYLSGPRSTYIVAVPIAARHKAVYVGCEAATWWRSTASAAATDSAAGQCECGAGWDGGGGLLLAGTGVVWQQLRHEWEEAAPSCLPLDVLDAVGLGTCRTC